MRAWIGLGVAAVLGLTPAVASADGTEGHTAVALASVVGASSPSLTAAQKSALAAYLAGHPAARGHAKITVTAAMIDCGAGDVDITSFYCDLTFGAATRHLTGRAANELYATLVEAGVASDGAAGTIHEGVTGLKCVLNPAEVNQNGGGGATCAYTPT
jgi:hypothetical protein